MMKYLTQKNLGWLLTALTILMLLPSGISKLMATDEMVKNFTYTNMTHYLSLVGALEVAAVVMLCVKKTSMWGAILITSIMSGAVSIHLSYMGGSGVLIPILIGALAWGAYYLRSFKLKLPIPKF
jgi:uncharacterized membrane protein YphA (DoxX/SURF4 family)